YAKERRAFGQPISKFQAIQTKLADLSTEIEAARLLTLKCAWLKDQGRPFGLAAAQAKLKTGRLAVKATDEAVQIHGGYGYMSDVWVQRAWRDSRLGPIGGGTSQIMREIIGKTHGL
ncbi:MAG: short-chain 2-methylacyl-CoA dehydrogenase, partial [Actinomycetota bacterium]|nr:short-chain 2-methylacyl-CoA dehydrogenase [Actinomycetota bacterium]